MEEVTLKEFLEQRLGIQDASLGRIETQVTRTNGRVTRLENWRSMLIGAWVVITVILLPTGYFVLELIIKK